jgi:hypothetical protein
MTNGIPNQSERDLLLRHLEALRSDLIRELLRAQAVKPLGTTKAETLERALSAINQGEISWDALVAYLDSIEPFGKQHVMLYETDGELTDWTEESVATIIADAGLENLWQVNQPIAAPDEMQLSSIGVTDGQLEVYAISRRSYLKRRNDLDNTGTVDNPDIETIAYERVPVRGWVRMVVDLGSGRVSIHMSQLGRKADYQMLLEDFLRLIETWFPVGGLETIDLGKAVKSLHEAWENGEYEASPQKLQYESPDGIQSSLSSSTRKQAVLGQAIGLDEAAKKMKETGAGAGANLYFQSSSEGAPAAQNPIDDPVHVEIVVSDGRINFRRPVRAEDLDYVMRRIRVHAG